MANQLNLRQGQLALLAEEVAILVAAWPIHHQAAPTQSCEVVVDTACADGKGLGHASDMDARLTPNKPEYATTDWMRQRRSFSGCRQPNGAGGLPWRAKFHVKRNAHGTFPRYASACNLDKLPFRYEGTCQNVSHARRAKEGIHMCFPLPLCMSSVAVEVPSDLHRIDSLTKTRRAILEAIHVCTIDDLARIDVDDVADRTGIPMAPLRDFKHKAAVLVLAEATRPFTGAIKAVGAGSPAILAELALEGLRQRLADEGSTSHSPSAGPRAVAAMATRP